MTEFMDSAAFAEQSIYRRIVKGSTAVHMTPSTRKVLEKFVNLWLYNRSAGSFQKSHDQLSRALKLADKTLRLAINWLRGKGFVRIVGGGLGRGNIASYAVDLTAIQESLAPDLAVRCAGETVDLNGEIKAVNPRAIKAVNRTSPYRDNNKPRSPSQSGAFVVSLRKSVDWDVLGTVLRRIATNRKAWFRPNPITGWDKSIASQVAQ